MDSQDDEVSVPERRRRRRRENFAFVIIQWCLIIVLSVLSLFILSLFLGFVAVFFSNSSITSPISVPSQCRIVSSSVDLRSSKVCELGFLNYKAKDVFYPFESNKFRCRYDYYWASVFKVEFKDHFSGQTRIALAEAPDEALPLKCRPNFGVAWLTKYKFKVNETYDCWYSSSITKVSLYSDGFFSCRAQDPPTIEMIKRYSILCTEVFESWFYSKGRAVVYWRWEVVAGLISGFLTSLVTISILRFLKQMISWLFQKCSTRTLLYLNQTCCFVAYMSFMVWLAIQYGKKLGLPEIFGILNSRSR